MPILEVEQLVDVDAWLRSVLWNSELPGLNSDSDTNDMSSNNFEIHRLKAWLPLSNGDIKIVQGVREVFEISDAPKPIDSAAVIPSLSGGKIVLIGKRLGDLRFEESFRNTSKPR